MKKTTLTAVVRNPATLQILLNTTDRLHKSGLLTSLRIIDRTSNIDGTVALRSLLPVDGETGKNIVMVDIPTVKSKDRLAVVARKLLGYHYQNTGFKLVPDGSPVTIACRSTEGCYIFVSKEVRSVVGSEIVLGTSNCFVRTGKGGGQVVATEDFSGVVACGTGWRTVTLSLDLNGIIKMSFDNGRSMSVDSLLKDKTLEVGISSTSKGIADFVVTNLSPDEMRPEFDVDRSYASYFSVAPERAEGVEIRSENDVIYIDELGWSLMSEDGVAVAVGDDECMPALKRMGIFKSSSTSKESHLSFINRSRGAVGRVRSVAGESIRVLSASKKTLTIENECKESGRPVLICSLDPNVVFDTEVLSGYLALSENGLSGEELPKSASDVLVYLDETLSSGSAESFFLELVEALSSDQRLQLLKIINNKLCK